MGRDIAATMAFGVEARVPFLDKEFLRIAMNVDAKHKIHKKGETDEDGKPYMEKVSRRSGVLWSIISCPWLLTIGNPALGF